MSWERMEVPVPPPFVWVSNKVMQLAIFFCLWKEVGNPKLAYRVGKENHYWSN